MLTKNQASQVADGLIAQQRDLSAQQQDAEARRVSFVYRCPEMATLPAREQAALLRRAKSLVLREWLVHITMIVLFTTVPLAWWVSHGEAGVSGQSIAVLALAAVAMTVLRTLIVRLVVRVLAGHQTHTGCPSNVTQG